MREKKALWLLLEKTTGCLFSFDESPYLCEALLSNVCGLYEKAHKVFWIATHTHKVSVIGGVIEVISRL